jgi:TPR repeat protein
MIRPLLRSPHRGRASAAFLLAAAVAVQSTQCATISPVTISDLDEVRQKAEAGDSRAQDALAEAYYHQFELTLAVQWFHKAAEQGVANSQWRLGTTLLGGVASRTRVMVVEKNPEEAVRWFFEAASQGHEPSQVALGNCYFAGGAVASDWIEAYKWYARAAERGSIDGRTMLNVLADSLTSEDIREGQRRAAVSGDECEVCRRLLEEARNPGASLELKGITGAPKKRLALISGQVLAPGEEAMLSLRSRKTRVKCLEIGEASATVLVDGKRIVLFLSGIE